MPAYITGKVYEIRNLVQTSITHYLEGSGQFLLVLFIGINFIAFEVPFHFFFYTKVFIL